MNKEQQLAYVAGLVWLIFVVGMLPGRLVAQQTNAKKVADLYRANTEIKTLYKGDTQAKISVDFTEVPLSQVLRSIAEKGGLLLTYRGNILPHREITLHSKSIAITEALDKVLKHLSLDYKISKNRYLLIIPNKKNYQEMVSGRVINANTGDPIASVNIVVQGTNLGTTTNGEGNYSLQVPTLQDTLVFSFVGYQSKMVPIRGRTEINVRLQPVTITAEELVVIGYGTQKKKNVTGSISSVSSEDLAEAPVHRVEDALQGRVTGVLVTASSGAPGAASTVRIRGTTSINNSDPLYVIDGMPVDIGGINYLNPRDIKSIQVLKDAASTAIYGTRGASGVILITTKDGAKNDFQLSYSSYYGVQEPANTLNLLNATEYATLRNEASIASDNGIVFENPQSFGVGTDWQEVIFNHSAVVMNQYLSFSGGTESATYYASFGYFDQQGIVATPISHQRKLSFRINSKIEVTDWLTFSENFGYTYMRTRGSLDPNTEYGGPLSSAINLDPITPVLITDESMMNSPPYSNHPVVRNDQGFPYGISPYVQQEMSNPLAYIETRRGNYGWSHQVVADFSLEVEPLKNLFIKTNIGVKPAFWGSTSFTPIYYLNAATYNTGSNSYYRAANKGLIWNWDNTINYVTDFKAHHFDILVGTSTLRNTSTGVAGTLRGIPADNFNDASMNYSVPTDQRLGSGWEAQPYVLNSYFGRLNYNYKGKYLLTAVLRIDGSSRFGSENRYGIFPAVSAGWVPTSESFWPENSVFDFLKIRASYGINGNDRSIGAFMYESTVSGGYNYVFGNQIFVGTSTNAPANPALHWEETSQLDVGFDATLFNSFTVTFDYYRKITSGMLLAIDIPSYVGASGNPVGNVSSLKNQGIELAIGYQKQFGDFGFNISANTSYNKNVITDIGDNEYLVGATIQAFEYPITRTAVGHPIGSFYGFKTLGIFQTNEEVNNYINESGELIQPNAQPGDFRWADLNSDGEITSADRTFIGNPTPHWMFGININVNWKQFALKIFGQGVAGNEIFQGIRRLDVTGANYSVDALNRWTGPGTSTTYPRLTIDDPNNNYSYPSEFYLSDGSYFKIRTVQLAYTLPVEIATNLGLERAQIYVRGQNLYTFTNYDGYDPEIGGGSFGIDRGLYPQARSYQIGLNITF